MQHAKNAKWYEEVRRIEITPYHTFELALEAEKEAIKNERPKYNIVSNDPLLNPEHYKKQGIAIREGRKRMANIRKQISGGN